MYPYPTPYPGAGQGNPYGPGPSGYQTPGPSPYPPYGAPGPSAPNPNAYTSWLDRVLASVIDQIPVMLIFFVGYGVIMVAVMAMASTEGPNGEPSDGAVAVMLLAMFLLFAVTVAFPVWNYGYRQGKTGQSIGKHVMKFKVVSEKTGQPIGFGMSLVRQMAHFVDSIFYIGYLMPLWDTKRQTIADKLMTTVCLPAPVSGPVPHTPTAFPGPQGTPNPYAFPPR